MSDMSKVTEPRSDQINADTLLAGPMTVTITGVKVTPGTEQPVSIALAETGLVYRPCKSMSRVLVAAWGADANAYVGHSLTLYRDPKVKWGGMEVGGIRISHMSGIERDMLLMLTETKASRKPFVVKPLRVSEQKSTPVNVTGAVVNVTAAPEDKSVATRDRLLKSIAAKEGSDGLSDWWADPRVCAALDALPEPMQMEVTAAYSAKMDVLMMLIADGGFGG